MAESGNLAIQERFVAAVFAGDAETLRTLCDPAFELHEGSGVPFAGVYRGADGFLQFLGIFMETFEIERLAPVRTYPSRDPDWAVFEFDVRATVRATGKLFESSLLESWHFKNGKVLNIRAHYFNSPLVGA